MLSLAFRNLSRRPLRNGLTLGGLAVAIAMLVCLSGFDQGYKHALGTELDRMGIQLMLVPLGCPYDAAARVLKAKALENTLPESAVLEARHDPAVAVAAPLLMAAFPHSESGRTDMWVGLDETALSLKPWWHTSAGAEWFQGDDSIVLGCDAAELEMRSPGDLFYSPEANRKLRVTGVLKRSGTSDDSLFFVPLGTAQQMFNERGRLTAVAIRLRDPGLVREASERLQRIPGAQVVTITEMMGVFLNLVGAARVLLSSIACIAVVVSALTVFNTLLAAVLERTNELSVLRALGASSFQVLTLVTMEGLVLTILGSIAGILLAVVMGHGVEDVVKQFLPLAPTEPLLVLTSRIFLQTLAIGVVVGIIGGLYPAWRASRLQPAAALKAD